MHFEKRMKLIVWCICLLMLIMPAVTAQDITQVRAHFDSDSISIGKAVPFYLTARYASDKQVVFPDSSFSFAPFEVSKKKFFTTKTVKGVSYDSVIYFLTTFEIDSIQRLALPVFVLQEKDCVKIFSNPDSVFFSKRVSSMPDSVSIEKLPLKSNTAYQRVSWVLNYPIIAIVIAALLIALVIAWIIFGKRIRRYLVLRRLNKDYQEFITRFTASLDKLAAGFTSRRAEDVLIIWKRYMEDLERYPYTKFTSREIVRLVNDSQLENSLRVIDRGIYGGFLSSVDSFRFLQSYSEQRFHKKESEVKNG